MKKVLVSGIVIILVVCFSGIVFAEPYTSKNPPSIKHIKYIYKKYERKDVVKFVGKFEI